MANEQEGVLTRLMHEGSAENQDAMSGGELYQRHRVTIHVPAHLTTLDLGDPDAKVQLTLHELTASEEARAVDAGNGGSATVGQALAKASLASFGVGGETEKVSPLTRDWLWERLGMRGRQAVAMAFAKHFTMDDPGVLDELLGKAEVG